MDENVLDHIFFQINEIKSSTDRRTTVVSNLLIICLHCSSFVVVCIVSKAILMF